MEQLFITIVNRGLTASLLVLAVIAIRFIFQRAPKRFRCVLWALVAFRLLCPFSVESVFSLVPDMGVILQAEEEVDLPVIVEPDGVDVLENVPPVTDEVADNIVDNIAGENNAAITDSTGQDSLQHNSEASAGEEVPPENSWKENLQTVGTYIWLAGIVSLGLYGVFSYLKVKNQVKVSLYEKENIYYCDAIETPFAFGMFRARIYLPSGLDDAAAEYVIRHEKEHLRCRDQWWKLLGFLLLAVYWFHPMLWVAYILFCKDIEYACDERVIKGLDEADRKEYVTALLNCSIGKKVILFCPTAFGETSVKGRIRSVLSYKKATLSVLLCAVALVALMVVAFLTDPVSKESQDSLLADLKYSTFSVDDSLTDTRVYCFSNNPVLERAAFLSGTESLDSPEKVVSMEKWDGEHWRVLSEGNWQEAVTATPNENTVKVDLTKEWEQYGEGLYRIVWNSASVEAEPQYYAKEIRLIDYAHIEKRSTLGTILSEEGEVTNVTILKNADILSMAEQGKDALLEFLMNMECVALQDSSVALGGSSNYTICMVFLSEDVTLKIQGKSGKTLDGREYSAVCTCEGMGKEILLYSEDGTWLEFLQKQMKWVSPTPAPGLEDELPPRTMIDGDIVQLSGHFTPIIPLFQEKIEQAKYCGIIRRISTGFPTEELESNSFQDGCKAYHYQDEFMETYIIVNPEGTKCFFAEGWTKYRWGETQLIKVEEREVNIFPTPIPTEAPANTPVASAAGTLVVGDNYAAYVDAAGNLHILYDMAGATKGVDREKKYKGLGLDRTCLVTIDVTGTVWAAYPYTADEVEAQMNELVEDAMAAGGNVGASHRDPELMRSFETLTSVRQMFCMYPYNYTALLEDGSLVTAEGAASEPLYGMHQFAQDENGVLAGIKEDGTFVIHTADVLRQKKFEEWPEKLQSICAGNYFVGLKEDGTVIAEDVELNHLINSVEGWKNIVSLSAAGDTVVGLKSDGTVVAVCKVGSDRGQCAVEEWKNIVAVDTNGSVTVGIQKDGSVLVAE